MILSLVETEMKLCEQKVKNILTTYCTVCYGKTEKLLNQGL